MFASSSPTTGPTDDEDRGAELQLLSFILLRGMPIEAGTH